MQKPEAEPLVDIVSSIEAPAAGVEKAGARKRAPDRVGIAFRGGRSAYLDARLPRSAVWAEVMESLRDAGQPVYVEIDPRTNLISELLVPIRMRVVSIEKASEEEGLEVHLAPSQARHLLRRRHPRFDALRRALEEARKSGSTVLVTDGPDGHEIVDVRAAEA